jgi:hypothetical protein
VGWCSAGGVCDDDDDCEGFLTFCENIEPQSCEFHENVCRPKPDCLDECYPPGYRILPTLEASGTVRIVFTSQYFDVVQGVLSELRADGNYSRTDCKNFEFGSYTDTDPLPPGSDGRYYLLRAWSGVSCTDHGDSSLTPDPRDALDASCPP